MKFTHNIKLVLSITFVLLIVALSRFGNLQGYIKNYGGYLFNFICIVSLVFVPLFYYVKNKKLKLWILLPVILLLVYPVLMIFSNDSSNSLKADIIYSVCVVAGIVTFRKEIVSH